MSGPSARSPAGPGDTAFGTPRATPFEAAPARSRRGWLWAAAASAAAHGLILAGLLQPPADPGASAAAAEGSGTAAKPQAATPGGTVTARQVALAGAAPATAAAERAGQGDARMPPATDPATTPGAAAAAKAQPAYRNAGVGTAGGSTATAGTPAAATAAASAPAATLALPTTTPPPGRGTDTTTTPAPAPTPAPTQAPAATPAAATGATAAAAAPTAQAAAAGAAGPSAQTSAAAEAPDPPPPVYATRFMPPVRLSYDMRRGAVSGTAELVWQPGSGQYALDLSTKVLGAEVLGLSSRGSFDSAGLAPRRFTDRRRGRDRLAANLDPAAGRITYSGPAVVQPLHPGTQDRLSWMVQLPAIVEADPARWKAGTRVEIFVTGARGDADTWSFQVQGREALALPAGRVDAALRLTREPRKPYDTQVEVWLDPARQHLPVRARMTVLPGGETLDLRLSGAGP